MRWSTTMLTLEWTWTWVECLLFFILIETGKCGPSGDPSECIQYNSNPLGWDGLGIGRILFFFFIDGLIFFSFIVLIELQTWSKIKYCFQRRRHPNRGRNIVQTCGAFLQIFIFFHRFLFPFFLFFFFSFFFRGIFPFFKLMTPSLLKMTTLRLNVNWSAIDHWLPCNKTTTSSSSIQQCQIKPPPLKKHVQANWS